MKIFTYKSGYDCNDVFIIASNRDAADSIALGSKYADDILNWDVEERKYTDQTFIASGHIGTPKPASMKAVAEARQKILVERHTLARKYLDNALYDLARASQSKKNPEKRIARAVKELNKRREAVAAAAKAAGLESDEACADEDYDTSSSEVD